MRKRSIHVDGALQQPALGTRIEQALDDLWSIMHGVHTGDIVLKPKTTGEVVVHDAMRIDSDTRDVLVWNAAEQEWETH